MCRSSYIHEILHNLAIAIAIAIALALVSVEPLLNARIMLVIDANPDCEGLVGARRRLGAVANVVACLCLPR